jgi:pyrroloquinoline quinone biosynthesis protein D
MSASARSERSVIGATSRPVLSRHVKMREDKARGGWTILAPERVFTPDPIALAVLQLCDGARSVEEIADELARTYEAERAQIMADVVPMLQDLADKGVVEA